MNGASLQETAFREIGVKFCECDFSGDVFDWAKFPSCFLDFW